MDEFLLRFDTETTYSFLDFETMNLCLNFQQNRPVQVAVLEVKNETVVNSYEARINWPDAPHLKVGVGAAMITRFNQQEHDKVAQDQQAVFKAFWPMLKRSDRIVIQNGLNFDLYLLKEWAIMMGEDWKWITPKILDTSALAKGLKLGIKYNPQKDDLIEYQYRMANTVVRGCKTNLAQLCKDYNIDVDSDRQHEAAYDLVLNKLVWGKMKFQLEI